MNDATKIAFFLNESQICFVSCRSFTMLPYMMNAEERILLEKKIFNLQIFFFFSTAYSDSTQKIYQMKKMRKKNSVQVQIPFETNQIAVSFVVILKKKFAIVNLVEKITFYKVLKIEEKEKVPKNVR